MRLHQNHDIQRQNRHPASTEVEPEQTAPLVTSAQLISNADENLSKPLGVGSIVGNRYRLQSQVGVGRLGKIYEAVDQQLTQAGQNDYRVVIELFTLHGNRAQESTRFASEFVDLLALSHPNLARIIDYGIDGTTSFIITELLEGASLRAVLDSASNEPCTENEILAVVGSVADVLRYTHAKGFVHGDLDPESVFITSKFDVKIVDFATVVLARSLGSVAEKQAGSSQSRKSSADVFGLAAIAYELLANEPPYKHASRHEARVRGIELTRINRLPRYRWKALAHALALRPRKRTSSVAEFAADFGVNGKVSMLDTGAPKRQSFYKRILWPLLPLIAVVATATLLQPRTLSDVWSNLRDRVGTQLVTIAPGPEQTEELGAEKTAVAAVAAPGGATPAVSIEAEPTMAGQASPESAQEFAALEVKDAGDAIDIGGTDMGGVEMGDSDSAGANAMVKAAAAQQDADLPGVISDPDSSADLAASEAATDLAQSPASAEPLSDPPSAKIAAVSNAAAIDTRTTSAANVSEPTTISFKQDVVLAYEGQDMAPISIQRSGPLDAAASILWWTANNTAVADRDYAELGVRTETFAAGENSMTVFVPLVSDNVRENRESFYAFVGSGEATTKTADRLEVVVIDNDQ